MQEKEFFDYDGVRVTNTRFIVDGQTYAMNNITSVKPYEKKPNRLWPILMVILGVILVFSRVYGGLLLSVIGVVWLVVQKTVYHLILHTAGGETSALTTNQKEYLQKVVSALNKAIVYRG